ncbi:MAG: hypothetical protein FWG51_03275, partial [Firmicutes bacterium]|nr:hypothetical protein [Bacillota bacterium]
RSSSITVPQNSYAIISVWVKTVFVNADGTYYYNPLDGQGATVTISGGVNYPVVLSGIHTDPDINDGWAQYQFIIEGSNMSSKTINLELGLGTGGPLNSQGYTEGFAFFANAVMEFITQKDFNDYNNLINANADEGGDGNGFELHDPIEYKVLTGTQGPITYRVKQKGVFIQQRVPFSFNEFFNDKILADTEDAGIYNLSVLDYNIIFPEDLVADSTDLENHYNINEYGNVSLVPILYNDALYTDKDDPLKITYPFESEDIVTIDKKDNSNISAGLLYKNFLEVYEDQFYKISFWLKTSELQSGSVSVYLYYHEIVDGVLYTYSRQITGIDTTKYNLSEDDRASVLNGNKNDDWRQYTFYVDGGLFDYDGSNAQKLSLEIWFGAVKSNYSLIGGSIVEDYKSGTGTGFLSKDFVKKDSYMMMSNITIEKLTSSVYSQASSAENSVTGFSLTNKHTSSSNSISNGSFNNPKPSEAKPNISDYDYPFSPADFSSIYGYGTNGVWQNAPAKGVLSGIINTNLWDNYLDNPAIELIFQTFVLDTLKTMKLLNLEVALEWNSLLMICNQFETAFGYYSPYKTLSANSYYEIKVQVLTSSLTGAGASVYLVDSKGERFTNYVLDSKGERIAPYESDALIYNPFYDETYDKDSEKYKNPSDQNDEENLLLRKGTKYVQANTIPALNPYYDKDFNETVTWKRETTKYYFLPNIEFTGATDLYFNVVNPKATIKEYYDQQAEFMGIKGTETEDEFTVFTFLIKTGYESLSLRLELWNGQRYLHEGVDYTTETDYKTTIYSEGTVFFDNAEMGTINYDDYYIFLFDEIGKPFNDAEMFYNPLNTMIFDVAAYNRMADPGSPDEEDTEEPQEDEDSEPFNWAALTSIIMAAALILALGAVVVRKYFQKKKKEETTVTEAPSYKRQSKSKQTKSPDKK